MTDGAPTAVGFRDFRAADRPELIALWVESWSEVSGAIDFESRTPWFGAHIDEWLAKGGVCICAIDAFGRFAGFILHDLRDGHLDQFCVRRDLKGSGVAQALMAEVKHLSPAGVDLEVNALNRRAIRFYEREGFERAGEGVNPRSGLPTFRYRWRP